MGSEMGIRDSYELLSIIPWKAVTLEYDLFGWISETYEDGPSARARLSYIVQSVVEFLRHPPFTSVEKSPACLYGEDAPESQALVSVYGHWQDCSVRLPEDQRHRIREIAVLTRPDLIYVKFRGVKPSWNGCFWPTPAGHTVEFRIL